MSETARSFAPVAAGSGQSINIAMQRLWLTGNVLPIGARLVVQHVFCSAEDEPLEVIYSFALPRDAALRSFRIAGDGFEARSELRDTADAVAAYEQGIAQGSLSALARQYGDGVVNLNVGNVRPGETVTVYLEILAGVELRDDGFLFRFPFALSPTYHSRARAALIGPGEAEMELPSDEFGDVILPGFRVNGHELHQVGFEISIDSRLELQEVGSSSHAVRISRSDHRRNVVTLAPEADAPNRDLILDARFTSVAPQVYVEEGPGGSHRFAAVVPSTSFGANPNHDRRVVILLDRSGSMSGRPLRQAIRAIHACLGALSADDLFGLVAFDNDVERFRSQLVTGSRENRDQAAEFLRKVDARGGTELSRGVLEAVKLLGTAGGDVFIITDGQVSGTEKILADVRAAHTRLHCLGIGNASQDRFIALLARETNGVSRYVTDRERVDLNAVELFASIGRPVAGDLKASQNVRPHPPSAVFSGTPAVLFGEIGSEENIDITWDGGRLNLPVSLAAAERGDTVWLLQGSRLISDWDSRYSAEDAIASIEKRRQTRIAAQLKELSRTYGLASREMSLVAVVKREADRPGELPTTRVVPVGVAQEVFGGYFRQFSASAAVMSQLSPALDRASAGDDLFLNCFAMRVDRRNSEPRKALGPLNAFRRLFRDGEQVEPEDLLLELASRMEADGGMPGPTQEARLGATIAALFAFLSQGHTAHAGAFRSHVGRLLSFLKSCPEMQAGRQSLIAGVLEIARQGRAPKGDWLKCASKSDDPWKEIALALQPSRL